MNASTRFNLCKAPGCTQLQRHQTELCAAHRAQPAKNPAAVALGRKGGQVKGPCKARTSEQARAAVNARWAKARAEQEAFLRLQEGRNTN